MTTSVDDVTDRRTAEERARQLNRILLAGTRVGDALTEALDEADLLERACRIAVDTGGYLLAWIGWKDDDRPGAVRVASGFGMASSYLDGLRVRWDDTPLGQGPTGRAIRLGKPARSCDVELEGSMEPWRVRLRAVGARSSAALPIRLGAIVAGALTVYSSELAEFGPEHLAVLEEISSILGRGVEMLRLRAEKERFAAAVSASERLLNQVLEALPVGVWLADADGRTTRSNPAARAIWEGERRLGVEGFAELVGWSRPTGRRMRPSDWAMARAVRGETVVEEEVEIACFDGTRKIVRDSAVPLRQPDGTLQGGVVVNQDVTARVHALEALAATAAELERSNQELQQFAYVASHDLQEPLRMVVSYLGLLERRLGPTLVEEHRKFLDYAVEGGRRMQQLIQDLLTLSRVGTHGVAFEDVDLADVAREALANLEVAIRESAAKIELDPLPTVSADRSQLVLLLQNLIGNALKFRSDLVPVVRLGAERRGARWRIAVEDNGIGIEPRHRERIFEPFQRLHPREAYPGTGIGLAICRRIVSRHRGRIRVETAPAGGSIFSFTLPAASEAAHDG